MANQISVEVRTSNISHEICRPQTVPEIDCSRRKDDVKFVAELTNARSKSALESRRRKQNPGQFSQHFVTGERESVRYICHSSWRIKKSPAPPWQASLDSPVELCVQTPTYSLARSRTKIYVDLREPSISSVNQNVSAPGSDNWYDPTAMRTADRNLKDYDLAAAWLKSDRDSSLDDLQQEIDTLAKQLEAERAAHKLTKIHTEKELRDKVNRLLQNNANELRAAEAANNERLLDLTDELTSTLNQFRKQATLAEGKAAREVETVEAKFAAYRSRLHYESTYAKKMQEFNEQCNAELQSRLNDLTIELMAKNKKDLDYQESLYQQRIHELNAEHSKQLEDLANRYSESEEHRVRLSTAEDRIKILEEELSLQENKHKDVCQEIEQCQAHNKELQRQLDCFKTSLEDRIHQIDHKYEDTLTNLTSNLVAIRRLYLKKCEQVDSLGDNDTTVIVCNDIKDTIKVLVETRFRSDVSFRDDHYTDDSNRRFSH